MRGVMVWLKCVGRCAATLLLGALAHAVSAAVEVVPDARVAAETSDNPRLRSESDPAVSPSSAERILAEMGVSVSDVGPRGELVFEPAVRSDRYLHAEDSELQSTDWYLRGRGLRRWQRARLGFSADLAHEKLLNSEFLGAEPGNPGDIIDVDGVLLGDNEIRTRETFRPYTEIDFGERSHVRLDARSLKVSYKGGSALNPRTDFADDELGAAYVRSLDSRTDLSTRVYGGRYDAVDTASRADTTGIEVRIERELSRIWSIAAAAGAERTDYTYVDASGAATVGANSHGVFDLDLRKRSERSDLTVGLSRRTRPDSFGSVVTRTELTASLARDFSVKLRGRAALRAIDSDALVTIPGGREYGRVEMSLEWRFRELWSLVTTYRYSYWNSTVLDTNAASNGFGVGVEYRGRSRRALQ